MTKLFNKPWLALLCLATILGITVSSCKKNDNTISNQVQLLSFGPSGAKVGDTIRFIGNNLNQVTEIDFTGKGAIVQQSAFIQQSPSLILVKVPQQAELGYVTLKTPQGNIVTKTQLNLDVISAITSITRQARPGDTITINGNYLNWVTKVTFYNNKPVDSFVSKSMNQLVVRVPVDAQTGPLIVSYGGTVPKDIQTTDTLNVTLPVATSFSPNPVLHKTNVTINGTDLDLVKQVLFTGVSTPVTTFVSQSATQLVVTVPSSTQSGKVTLVAASGVKTQSATDLNVVLPAVTTMTPNPVDPGANLTLTGTNLNLVTSVTFQNAPAVTSFVSQSDTQIVVTVPTGVLKGKLTLGVLNSTLTVQTDVLNINGSVPPPTIAFPIYNDAVTSNWNGWVGNGWGGTKNLSNTNPVREGNYSVEIDYTAGSGLYGSPLQLGGASINIPPTYTTFKISIYGAPGSGGKPVKIVLNGSGGYTINVVEGQWTDYSIPLSSLISGTKLTDIWIQDPVGNGGFTIYVDDIGLN